MKILLAFLGAFIGAAAGVLYLAPFVSNYVQGTQTFASPDEAMNMHNLVYLLTGFFIMILGWIIGLLIGGSIEDAMARRKG